MASRDTVADRYDGPSDMRSLGIVNEVRSVKRLVRIAATSPDLAGQKLPGHTCSTSYWPCCVVYLRHMYVLLLFTHSNDYCLKHEAAGSRRLELYSYSSMGQNQQQWWFSVQRQQHAYPSSSRHG